MALELLSEAAPVQLRSEIKQNIKELDQLIDEILLSSRLEAGLAAGSKASLDHLHTQETIDLTGMLAEECARVNAEFTITLEHDEMKQAAQQKCEAKLLRRLFRNLLENAVRYGKNSLIEVSLNSIGGKFSIEIMDRGDGVPIEECERIFEAFYRMPGASETNGGVGLGLSLVRQIAEKHAGTVVCLPREGGGTCFRLILPFA